MVQKKNESFFGYYNNRPINEHGNVAWIEIEKKIAYIVVDGEKITSTSAFNLQQGCMLTWLDNNYLIFNDLDEKSYCSKIINKTGELVTKIRKPIYTVASNKEYALTLDFERLSILRPDYGYTINWKYILNNYNDGIYRIDLENNVSKLIISFKDILNFNFKNEEQFKHKLNHIDISPDNKRFIFIHRWFNSHGIKQSRLLLANSNGDLLKVIANEKMVSHCCWRDKDNIIGWFKHNGQDNYYNFSIKDNTYEKIDKEQSILTEDGHPSVKKDFLITDTYPDKSRYSHIIVYNLKKNKGIRIVSMLSPMKYFEEKRCDLHPRWGIGNSFFFDSTHEGKRFLYKINFKEDLDDFCNNERL